MLIKSFVLKALLLFFVMPIGNALAVPICLLEQGCVRIAAIGHGVVEAGEQSVPQRQLLAIRAAKLDAVRSLAEQVRGMRINSETSSNAYGGVTDRTSMRMDTVLRGVRYVKVEPVEPGVYQARVEIDVYY